MLVVAATLSLRGLADDAPEFASTVVLAESIDAEPVVAVSAVPRSPVSARHTCTLLTADARPSGASQTSDCPVSPKRICCFSFTPSPLRWSRAGAVPAGARGAQRGGLSRPGGGRMPHMRPACGQPPRQ